MRSNGSLSTSNDVLTTWCERHLEAVLERRNSFFYTFRSEKQKWRGTQNLSTTTAWNTLQLRQIKLNQFYYHQFNVKRIWTSIPLHTVYQSSTQRKTLPQPSGWSSPAALFISIIGLHFLSKSYSEISKAAGWNPFSISEPCIARQKWLWWGFGFSNNALSSLWRSASYAKNIRRLEHYDKIFLIILCRE